MRVLTIHQPWASYIADGRKPVENRPQRVAKFAERLIGEDVAIHASASFDRLARSRLPDGLLWPRMIYGAILAVVAIDRVEPPWGDKPDLPLWRNRRDLGIYFTNVRKLPTPVPYRGGQGWRVLERTDPSAYNAVMEQIL